MTTIATLAVRLIADVGEYTSTMQKASATAQETATKIGKSMQDTGASIMSVGKNMTTWVTLPILGAGVAALNYASNLEETKNKVSVVFGSMTKDVMAWSQTSDTAMGMSQQKALDAVSTFGAMGASAGLNAQDNLRWSQSLVQLGSDWSSFYNLNPVDSLNAIQSAVAGQYEPLRRMGIVINDTSLKQKAMQMGLMEEGGTLSDVARYQALYALMVEKSSAAQGDFARTADGVANQTRIVKAQFENAAATLGQQLLPYATQLLSWVSQAITWFQALTPEQQKWIIVILAIAAAVGPVLVVVGFLVTAIGAIIPVVTAVGGALLTFAPYLLVIAAVVGLLYLAWTNNWGGIQEKTASVIEFVKNVIDGGMQFIHDMTSGKLGGISQVWNNTVGFITTYINNGVAMWKALMAAFHAAMTGDWHTFGAKLREIADLMVNNLEKLFSTAWDNTKIIFSGMVTSIINFFKDTNWGEVGKNIVTGIGNGITSALQWLKDAARRAAQAALDAAKGFLGIQSPSKVFEMQVGWQMAAGVASGWERGLDTMFTPTMPQLSPAAIGNVPSLSGMGSGSSSRGSIHITVENRPLLSLGDRSEAEQVLKPMLLGMLRDLGVEVNR